jgi:hypothetical protein
MAIQRHDGTGWAGAARATYTLFEKNVSGGGPPIWLRARTIWRVTDGGWQPASAGYAPGADVTLSAATLARTHNGGTEILDPVTGDSNVYWESYVDVTAGWTCNSYALWWRYHAGGEDALWRFMHSANISPGGTTRVSVINGSSGHYMVQWCATGFQGQIGDHLWIPPGQQGFSRFALG